MKTSKKQIVDCPIEATFVGGFFNGEKMWFDVLPGGLLRTSLIEPGENDVTMYKGDTIYKLASENPAIYEAVEI